MFEDISFYTCSKCRGKNIGQNPKTSQIRCNDCGFILKRQCILYTNEETNYQNDEIEESKCIQTRVSKEVLNYYFDDYGVMKVTNNLAKVDSQNKQSQQELDLMYKKVVLEFRSVFKISYKNSILDQSICEFKTKFWNKRVQEDVKILKKDALKAIVICLTNVCKREGINTLINPLFKKKDYLNENEQAKVLSANDQRTEMEKQISKICKILEFSKQTREICYRKYKELVSKDCFSGQCQEVKACAVIFMVTRMSDQDQELQLTQKDLSDAAGISQSTLKSILKKLKDQKEKILRDVTGDELVKQTKCFNY